MNARIGVIGGGAWGSALAIHLARAGHAVGLWMLEPDLVQRLRDQRDNPRYLPGVRFPENVEPHAELAPVVDQAEMLVSVVPSAHARSQYEAMRPLLDPATPLVLATKGIEEGSLALPLDVLAEVLGDDRPRAVLSGPSFAREVAEGQATAVVAASADAALAQTVQERFSTRSFRVYTNDDPIGVQIAGAMKNVIAIAAGVADALGTGTNARAALITRGLAEMGRLGRRLGARPETFSGLAGMGDLVLTCTGELSRNHRVGQRLGRGERLQDILDGSHSVAEGVGTTVSARALARREGLSLPIVDEVYRLLYESGAPGEAIQRLMSRPLRPEHPTESE